MSESAAESRSTRGSDDRVHGRPPLLRPIVLAVGGYPAWVGIASVLAVVAIVEVGGTGIGATLPTWARYLPLAASLVLFGLPHGAVDHLAPARAAGQRPSVRWLLSVGVVYLVLGVAYAAVWFLSPVAAAAAFIAMTWFHWGQGDLYALDGLGADHLDDRRLRFGSLVVRGGLPMLVPLVGHPEAYRAVVDSWVALFGSSLDAAWLVSPTVRTGLGVGFALVTVGTLLAGRRRAGSGDTAWRLDAAETALLWAFFLVVPPIFAVGVYFCVWHSLRHIARLVAVDPASRRAFDERGTAAALGRTGLDALPLTVVALATLLAVGVISGVEPNTQAGQEAAAALYLVFISVLTLPHVAIVTWMDWVENAGVARIRGEQ
ncbi:Brp/Blh family beta-carotene 15,15'-dioxygenase [Halobellus rufus]|uniref:Brp/Blh family beta-carotene 15,15'-dioxygenase n=1 Tax=Halobellus rufus TaxID=1448860 RepID=UPI0009DEEDBB|nr:Brp/Blh family beta-carotene 15,15'-dioxygenase [Halobellus rufus]